MRAEAQNLKNFAEYFKIDSAKKTMAAASGFNLAAMAVNVTKKQFLT